MPRTKNKPKPGTQEAAQVTPLEIDETSPLYLAMQDLEQAAKEADNEKKAAKKAAKQAAKKAAKLKAASEEKAIDDVINTYIAENQVATKTTSKHTVQLHIANKNKEPSKKILEAIAAKNILHTCMNNTVTLLKLQNKLIKKEKRY